MNIVTSSLQDRKDIDDLEKIFYSSFVKLNSTEVILNFDLFFNRDQIVSDITYPAFINLSSIAKVEGNPTATSRSHASEIGAAKDFGK